MSVTLVRHGSFPTAPAKSQSAVEAEHPLYADLIGSEVFQRLKCIAFLGAIDYVGVIDPKPKQSRYEHTLGVAKLALEYSAQANLTENEQNLLVVAALLHDIGHAPLSHSLEPLFKHHFHIDHHHVGELLIKGELPLGKEISMILRKHRVQQERIIALLNGEICTRYSEAITCRINIDTIDAITRSSRYIFGDQIGPSSTSIVRSLVMKDEESWPILDSFWRLKDVVYSSLICGPLGALADNLSRAYMRRNLHRFSAKDFTSTDTDLLKRHTDLLGLLSSLNKNSDEGDARKPEKVVRCKTRAFIIDESVRPTDGRDFHNRYKHVRLEARVKTKPRR